MGFGVQEADGPRILAKWDSSSVSHRTAPHQRLSTPSPNHQFSQHEWHVNALL